MLFSKTKARLKIRERPTGEPIRVSVWLCCGSEKTHTRLMASKSGPKLVFWVVLTAL